MLGKNSAMVAASSAFWLLLATSATAADLGTEAQRQAGKALYDKHCAHCHGPKGAAETEAALRYKPMPRDFTRAKFKIRSTNTGELPTDADLKLAIQRGLAFHIGQGAYTTMPPWPKFTDEQLMELVYYVKSFSPNFANDEYNNPKPVTLPPAPVFSAESATRGRKVFESNECIKCHGTQGRGNGPSAPTLKDDWDKHIRPADLTKRWTFRGGGAREDIFRTITTGFNGTPMPAYGETVNEADRWDLVNYVYSLSRGDSPDYNKPDRPIVVSPVTDLIDITDFAKADALFKDAAPGFIALAGQVIEQGREFHPAATEVEVSAVYNNDDVAVRLRWHDMIADTGAENSPSLAVEEVQPKAPAAEAADKDPFADEESAAPAKAADDDPFAEESSDSGSASGPVSPFSDAVAVQLPAAKGEGFHLPYFIFGDNAAPVDLWFLDLSKKNGPKHFVGKGSKSLSDKPDAELHAISEYKEGEWTVIFKRKRAPAGSFAFEERSMVPVAFSVWDGFNEERGNKRSLTSWYNFYVEPMQKESVVVPMCLYGGGLFLLELLVIGLVRRRNADVLEE